MVLLTAAVDTRCGILAHAWDNCGTKQLAHMTWRHASMRPVGKIRAALLVRGLCLVALGRNDKEIDALQTRR